MCITICGRFRPDEGAVGGYGNRIRAKYTAKWSVQVEGMIFQTRSRACLKKAFCKMCVTICGRFRPDEGAVAGYNNQIRVKYTAKWGVQIAGMIFQTGSRSGIILHALLYIALYLSTLQSALHPVFRIHRKPSQIFLAMGFPLCMGVLCG